MAKNRTKSGARACEEKLDPLLQQTAKEWGTCDREKKWTNGSKCGQKDLIVG
jgi:hypothetical protein